MYIHPMLQNKFWGYNTHNKLIEILFLRQHIYHWEIQWQSTEYVVWRSLAHHCNQILYFSHLLHLVGLGHLELNENKPLRNTEIPADDPGSRFGRSLYFLILLHKTCWWGLTIGRYYQYYSHQVPWKTLLSSSSYWRSQRSTTLQKAFFSVSR